MRHKINVMQSIIELKLVVVTISLCLKYYSQDLINISHRISLTLVLDTFQVVYVHIRYN